MKFWSLCVLSLFASFSVQAETHTPNTPKQPEVEHHERAASKVDTRPAFNESLAAEHHHQKSSRQQAQDVDSGLQLNETAVEGRHHLSVVNGGINLPKDTLVTVTQK